MMSLEAAVIQPEPTVEEQIEQAEYLLDWLNELWKTDKEVRNTIDDDRWKDFIDSIEAWLDELEDSL